MMTHQPGREWVLPAAAMAMEAAADDDEMVAKACANTRVHCMQQ